MPKQVCIYCWKTQGQVAFSAEHIIPESLRGRLTLEDHVCVGCNSWLGAHVDHHILRVPDILAAQVQFADEKTHDRVLKHNFNIKLVSETGAEFLAHARGQKLQLLTQAHPIQGMIYSESSIRESLRKSFSRQSRHKIPKDMMNKEIKRLCQWMKEASPGEEFYSTLFDLGFTKRSETLQTKVEPKTIPDVKSLIAKIAYEFIFIVMYKRLFTTGDLATRLLEAITSSHDKNNVFVHRIESQFQQLQPFHFIRFYRYEGYVRVDVGFYGYVHYMLFAPVVLPQNFFQNLSEQFDFPQMVGVHYEQHFSNASQGFWALGMNGKIKPLTG